LEPVEINLDAKQRKEQFGKPRRNSFDLSQVSEEESSDGTVLADHSHIRFDHIDSSSKSNQPSANLDTIP
jgi:hypothetical protein